MRTWTQAKVARRCGRCGTLIPIEAPILLIRIAGVTREKARCARCAGESSPIASGPFTARLIPFGRTV